jgi:signal recognition particle subunit SRP54
MFESISDKLQSVFKKLRGRGKLTEANIKDAMREVRLALLEADVNYRVVKDFVEAVRQRAVGREVAGSLLPAQQVIKIVHEEMVKLMEPAPLEGKTGFADTHLNLDGKPSVIMLVGLQGCGKTTTLGKLAFFLKSKGLSVLMIPADTRRPAAVEQLEVLGREIGVPVHSAVSGREPVQVVEDGVREARERGLDAALIDTGGRLHIDDELMSELAEMKKRVSPQEVLLVIDAMTGQDAVREASEFEKRLSLDGVILTKLDGDARGGAALSVRKVIGKPVKFVGVGEKMDALEAFLPDRIASRILGMGDVLSLVEKVETLVAEEEREKWEKKMAKGDFSLEDLLAQLQLTKRMGGLSELAQMIPGGGNLGSAAVDEKKLCRVEAIVRSMTAEERKRAGIIDGSRRRRIAEGSGTSVQEVNALLKQFGQMKKFIKNFQKKGLKGGGFKWQLS